MSAEIQDQKYYNFCFIFFPLRELFFIALMIPIKFRKSAIKTSHGHVEKCLHNVFKMSNFELYQRL